MTEKFSGKGVWIGSQRIQRPNQHFHSSSANIHEKPTSLAWKEAKFTMEGNLIECFGKTVSMDEAMKIIFGFNQNKQKTYSSQDSRFNTSSVRYNNLVSP